MLDDVHNSVELLQTAHLRHDALSELVEYCLGIKAGLLEVLCVFKLVVKTLDGLDEADYIVLLHNCLPLYIPSSLYQR